VKAILTDITKCIGCLECVVACKNENQLARDLPRNWHRTDGLSARNWTSIVERDNRYARKQCRHCLDPACVSACPVAALIKTEMGPVVYDASKCIGCRYCMIACPYGIPRYDWDKAIPYIQKCDMCLDRLKRGEQPACTAACPEKATIFGDRDELLAEAHRRIRAGNGKYINKVWGEHDVGGTSVLYISDIDLDFLTYPKRTLQTPLPATTAPAMYAVPPAFVGMGALMGGLYWFFRRREKVQREQQKEDN
jgi:formate dehydrogenase iron-sulfur subunit